MENSKTTLSQAAIKARREYKAKWRKQNKEHIKEYNAKYWERKASEAETPTQ